MSVRTAFVLSLGLAALLAAPPSATAQTAPSGRPAATQAAEAPVTLAADRVSVERDGRLTAEGHVEIWSGSRYLQASRIVYDRDADRLHIDGPILLTEGPQTILLASAADLTPDLREGLIDSARLILDQRLQIAAAQAQRQQGRFTDLRNTVATSCEICRPGQAPLWELRAARVIHDQERQRIWFEHAQFRIRGMPVAYLPALSVPEPGVRRARGFLVPKLVTSDLFGTGPKLPYFLPFGDHADLTLTPFATYALDGAFTRTLEARYRQAFTKGAIEFNGAISEDSVSEYRTRAYLFGEGRFDLPEDTKLRFNIETTRDDAYLSDYDYSGKDRLQNRLNLTRVKGDTRAEGEINLFKSLRQDEENDTLPVLIGDARIDRRWQVPRAGGFLDFSLIGHGHQRPSSENIAGRDMSHGRAALRYAAATTAGPGLRLGAEARLIGDIRQIDEDDRYKRLQSSTTPGLALSASLPMQKPGDEGVYYLLEPLAELVWTGDYGIDAPNDDSSLPAFDRGNLTGFQRFPGLDRVEDGLRANIALRWRRLDPKGLGLGVTLGRVLRTKASDLFSTGTGLDGTRSDWMVQFDLDLQPGLALRSLSLIEDGGRFSLNETRVSWTRARFDLSTGYVWQQSDPALGLTRDVSELNFDGSYRITESWAVEADLHRDFISERTVRAGFGVSYTNECVRVDLSGQRRFRNTENAEPTYSYGILVSLGGFGSGNAVKPRTGRCSVRG